MAQRMPAVVTRRCGWAGEAPLYVAYHDEEWGVPSHDDQRLFEMLILEGAQAGLSWITILNKREHYRRAFDQFDPEKVARYGEGKVSRLLNDPGIVRNRLKIAAAIGNARAFLDVRDAYGSFDAFVWQFVDGQPVVNHWKRLGDIPSHTPQSDAMSMALKKCGFRFVGPTICYAYMQAVGMVNDHIVSCFRHKELMKRQ